MLTAQKTLVATCPTCQTELIDTTCPNVGECSEARAAVGQTPSEQRASFTRAEPERRERREARFD